MSRLTEPVSSVASILFTCKMRLCAPKYVLHWNEKGDWKREVWEGEEDDEVDDLGVGRSMEAF